MRRERTLRLKQNPMTVWKAIIYVCLFVFMACCLFPLLYEVMLSVSSRDDFLASKFIVIPKHFNLEMYKLILFQDLIGRSFIISVCITLIATVYSMAVLSLGVVTR